jgi:5'-phosphate synthase pdxT subunit
LSSRSKSCILIFIPTNDLFRVQRKPTWGTCAGLILLAESANRTKKGGQELIGGLDVRVNRNHFGRQTESFEMGLNLPFLKELSPGQDVVLPFTGVFIRAPVVERILQVKEGAQVEEAKLDDTIIAPSLTPAEDAPKEAVNAKVEVLAELPKKPHQVNATDSGHTDEGDIIAVRQGNVFATSFHPELTGDGRIHRWWLQQVVSAVAKSQEEI